MNTKRDIDRLTETLECFRDSVPLMIGSYSASCWRLAATSWRGGCGNRTSTFLVEQGMVELAGDTSTVPARFWSGGQPPAP
jgi:hypothetical protein